MKRPANRPDPARLLEAFVTSNRCEKTFAKLVESLNGLVFSSALRRTGSAQLAEEVAQNVFALLARKADSLRRHPALTAWALKTTRLQSANAMRSERRRQRKLAAFTDEAKALDSPSSNAMDDQPTWKDAVPFLDEALDRLSAEDQKVILQRFYEEKKFKEIASQSGQTEAACKKRVQRALQKLSSLLGSRGVTLSGTAVASLLGAEFARAVPAHTAATMAPKALAASSSLSTTTVGANTLQTMSTVKSSSLTTAAVLALAALPISQQIAEGNRLRSDLQSVREQSSRAAGFTGGGKSSSRGPAREKRANRGVPRTPRRILNSLAVPMNSRELVNEVVSEAMGNYDLLGGSILIARLADLSEEEFGEFLNEFDRFPMDGQAKYMLMQLLAARHPGLEESSQGTVERQLATGTAGWAAKSALEQWVGKDPDAALKWYREMVASEEIHGTGLDESFEKTVFRALVVGLAESRPREALEVFQSRPGELAQSVAHEVTSGLAKAMMASGDDSHVRRMMTLRDPSDVLFVVLREYGRAGNFGEGVAFVDRSTADPRQRTGILTRAVRAQKTVKSNHAALDWIQTNTPASDAPEIFRSLGAEGAIRGDWLENQDPGPNRDQAYLGGVARLVQSRDFPEALSQAWEIADGALRLTVMEDLGRQWLRRDKNTATRQLPPEVLRRLQNSSTRPTMNRPFWISLILSISACAMIMALLAFNNTRLSDQLATGQSAAGPGPSGQGRAGGGSFSNEENPAGSSREKVERAVARLDRFTATLPSLVPGKTDQEQPADRGLFWDKLPELLKAVEGLSVDELIEVANRIPVEPGEAGDEKRLFYKKTFDWFTIAIPAEPWPNVVRNHLLMLAAEQDPTRFYQDEDVNEQFRFSTLQRLARVDPAAAVDLMPQFVDQDGKKMDYAEQSHLAMVVLESDVGVGLDLLISMRPKDQVAPQKSRFAFASNHMLKLRLSESTVRQVAAVMDNPEYRSIRTDLIQLTLDHHLRENGIGKVAFEARRLGLTADDISGYIDSTAWITMKTSPRETIEWMSNSLTTDQQVSQVPEAFLAWAAHDVFAAADWLGYQEPSPVRDRAIVKFATTASDLDPESARLWALEIQDEQLREQTLRKVENR